MLVHPSPESNKERQPSIQPEILELIEKLEAAVMEQEGNSRCPWLADQSMCHSCS